MKTAFLTGARQFEVKNPPDLRAPEDGLVLRVQACGVCGSDLRRWKEGLPPGGEPITPGHEIAGIVVEVGAHVQRYQVGDQLAVAPDVHCGKCYFCARGLFNLCDNLKLVGITPGYPGGFAEQMILTDEILNRGIVHPIPAGMPFTHAALAEPLSSVLAAHEKIGAGAGDTILVLGGGPIGCLHMAVAHASGARVILSEPSPIRRQMAHSFHPDLAIDPSRHDLVNQVRQFTAGCGATAAICANPIAETQTQAVECVRKGGKVILFGGLPKSQPLTSLDGNRIHYGEISVVGSFSYHPSFHKAALEMIQRAPFSAKDLITHIFPLEKIDQAFQTAASGEALKVMVSFIPDPVDVPNSSAQTPLGGES